MMYRPEKGDYLVSRMDVGGVKCLDIDGKNLVYAEMGLSHHGVQCNFTGGTLEHEAILQKCRQIVLLFKEIEQLQDRYDHRHQATATTQ